MDEFYRIPLTSGEALASLAVLKAVSRLSAPDATGDGVDLDIEPGILPSAADRFAGEVPEFVVERADRLAASLLQSLREWVRPVSADVDDGAQRDEPPFPIGRTRRLLEDAFGRRVPVEIEYFVRSRNEWTTRRVDISDIYEDTQDVWFVSGRCGLRDDFRLFRLDHIRSVRVLDDEEGGSGLGRDPFAEE